MRVVVRDQPRKPSTGARFPRIWMPSSPKRCGKSRSSGYTSAEELPATSADTGGTAGGAHRGSFRYWARKFVAPTGSAQGRPAGCLLCRQWGGDPSSARLRNASGRRPSGAFRMRPTGQLGAVELYTALRLWRGHEVRKLLVTRALQYLDRSPVRRQETLPTNGTGGCLHACRRCSGNSGFADLGDTPGGWRVTGARAKS